jgi:uncharacterized protein (DUF488 family)
MIVQRVYSIGHSNHALEEFLALLGRHAIEVLVDVRSQPYSRFAPHFNQEELRRAVEASGVRYLFLGRELGGRPPAAAFYDAEGYVLYDRVAQAPFFKQGIDQVVKLSAGQRAALLCSEEDPTVCHRFLLVGRVLNGLGVEVQHIRGDGRVQSDAELAAGERKETQGMLFAELEESPWKSIRSVLPKKQLPSSSEP